MKVVIKAVSYRLKSVNRFSYTVIETIKIFSCQQKERQLGPKRKKQSPINFCERVASQPLKLKTIH